MTCSRALDPMQGEPKVKPSWVVLSPSVVLQKQFQFVDLIILQLAAANINGILQAATDSISMLKVFK